VSVKVMIRSRKLRRYIEEVRVNICVEVQRRYRLQKRGIDSSTFKYVHSLDPRLWAMIQVPGGIPTRRLVSSTMARIVN
jgi:hypothetical protein